jgi:hypothetical protein
MDASGIASIDTLKNIAVVHKVPVPGFMFRSHSYADALIRRAAYTNTITICHTRAGTSGGGGMDAAHPFLITDEDNVRQVVGVHNGTLTGWNHKPAAKHCNVDSEWIFTHIFNKGADAFKDFTGAYALVWWDSDNPKVLNIARNKERTMYVALLDDDGMAFASEPGMLQWLLDRRGIKQLGKIKEIIADMHYQFPISDFSKYTKEPLRQPVVSKAVSRAPVTTFFGTSVFDKVDNFLKEVRGSTAAGGRAILRRSITKEEIDYATELKLLNLEGTFTPIYEDEETGIILGDFLSMGGKDYTAEIRGLVDAPWDKNTYWHTKIVGVEKADTLNKEITVICAKPVMMRKDLALVH